MKKVITTNGYPIPDDLSEEFLGVNLGNSLRLSDSKRGFGIGSGSGSRDELSDMEAGAVLLFLVIFPFKSNRLFFYL